jgi:predicted RNA binding protein YcfA (HicA-like mRNA interferase family)
MIKYTIAYTEEAEGGFSGRCLELPGAISQGETLEELKVYTIDASPDIRRDIRKEEDRNRSFIMMITNHNSDKILVVLTKHYGFVINRISDSHFQLNHPDGRRLTIPRHSRIKLGVINILHRDLVILSYQKWTA